MPIELKEHTREEYEAAKLTWGDVSDLVGEKDEFTFHMWQERWIIIEGLHALLEQPYMKNHPRDPSVGSYIIYHLTRLYRWITWKNVNNAK